MGDEISTIQTILDKTEFNLYVSKVGNIVLIYKGTLDHQYDWVQLDSESNSLDFITAEGEHHNLGVKVPQSMQQKMDNTKELMMIEVKDDNSHNDPVFIRLIKTT